ncbi:MAG TPA: hypothetical protein VHC48_15250 [Puia sp.]|nr:hypothetical protein [Puia sp.]
MKTLVLFLTSFVTVAIAQAQNAGNWPLNSNLNGAAGSHLSVSTVSLGSSIPSSSFNGGSEWYGEGGWPSGVINLNAYVQVNLTSNSGYYLALNTVTLVMRRSNTGSPAGAGPTNWSLRSSLDNYTTDIATGGMTYNYATYTVTLPASFLTIASSITFRIYGYNTTVNSGGISRMVFDNISVQGQAVSGVLAAQSIHLAARADNEKHVTLQWDAAGFVAGTSFTVERSSNGADFAPIFNTESTTRYDDAAAPATAYYRVTAGLPDGSAYFSPVVSVRRNQEGRTAIRGVTAQGNTVRTYLHLEAAGAYQVGIWSQDGRPLVRRVVSDQAGDVQSDIAFSYPHGVYILTVSSGGAVSSRKFLF